MKLYFAPLVIARTLSGGVASDETASPTLSRPPTKSHEPADSATISSTVFVPKIDIAQFGACVDPTTEEYHCHFESSSCKEGEVWHTPAETAQKGISCTCDEDYNDNVFVTTCYNIYSDRFDCNMASCPEGSWDFGGRYNSHHTVDEECRHGTTAFGAGATKSCGKQCRCNYAYTVGMVAAVEIGSTPYGICYNYYTDLQFCAATAKVCDADEEYRGPYSAAFSGPECTCDKTHTGACVNVAGPGQFTFGHCGVAADSCNEGELYLTATALKESVLLNDCRLCENTWDETASPTESPTDFPTEIPSAAPSMPPNSSKNDVLTCSCTGDPHYKTWDGAYFSFQGNCDQILIDNDILQLQVRTRPYSDFSIISQVALKLKNPNRKVFQFIRGEDPRYFPNDLNKIDYEQKNEKFFYAELGFDWTSPKPSHIFRFKDDGKDEYIKVTETWHGGFGVNVKGNANRYSGSEGMCGTWNGGMKKREDGETITVTDSTSINAVRSWQVGMEESILNEPSTYCEAYTKPCDHVSFPDDGTFDCSRRMIQNNQGNSTVTPTSDLECADLSCGAIADPTMRAFCQSDVRISGDPRWACQIDYLLSDVVIPDPCEFDVEKENSKFLRGRKDGSTKIRTCGWLKKRKDKLRSRLCTKQVHYFENIATGEVLTPPQIACPDTCASCDKCFENPKTKYTHNVKEGDTPTVYKNCKMLAKRSPEKVKQICNRFQSAGGYPTPIKACPVTCGLDTCVL